MRQAKTAALNAAFWSPATPARDVRSGVEFAPAWRANSAEASEVTPVEYGDDVAQMFLLAREKRILSEIFKRMRDVGPAYPRKTGQICDLQRYALKHGDAVPAGFGEKVSMTGRCYDQNASVLTFSRRERHFPRELRVIFAEPRPKLALDNDSER